MNENRERLEQTQAEWDGNETDMTLDTLQIFHEGDGDYWHLIEFSPEAIFMLQDDRIVYANRAGARLVRAEAPETLVGRSVREFIHADNWPTLSAYIDRLDDESR